MKNANLSTTLSAPVKAAVSRYCKSRGLKIGHFIEHALIECLEDQADLQAYEVRKHEDTIPLSRILKSRKKPSRR
ncbi:MAG: hypothetical protein V1798_00485 [Pseudomonadota bacterium]